MSFNTGIFYPSLDEDSSTLEHFLASDKEQENEMAVAQAAHVNSDLEYMNLLEQLSLEESKHLEPKAKPTTLPTPSQPIPICTPIHETYGSTFPQQKSRLASIALESGYGSVPSIVYGMSPPMASYMEPEFGTSQASSASPWAMEQPLFMVTDMGIDHQFANASAMKERYCEFCFNNERVQMERMGIHIKPSEPGKWHTHVCKDAQGNVVCPVLYKFNCKYCGAAGSKAHTRRYCPIYQQKMLAESDKPTLIPNHQGLIAKAAQIPEEALSELENLTKSLRNLKNIMGENFTGF
uniref:Nanos-type domain-containing protein n=1 Tax=Acrobeloides nanus TaxID=290746 RepID=A0A914EBP3_9BILA